MQHRRTLIVHTILAGHMSRVDAARRNETGVQVMTMGQLAARLAGGLLQPVDLDVLTETVRDALPDVEMGELEPIKDLPGMPAAVTATFDTRHGAPALSCRRWATCGPRHWHRSSRWSSRACRRR
jgi:hypothetical protein